MNETIKTIEIDDFIKIRILDLNSEDCVYFVEKYNKKYFYIKEYNRLRTHQYIPTFYSLYFQKANIIHRSNLNGLEQDVYNLYRQLTFKIERAKKNTRYYTINSCFEVREDEENNHYIDNNRYNNYNYFLSKAEAEKYAKILQEELIKLRKEEMKKENK